MSLIQGIIDFFLDFLETIVVSLAIFVILYLFAFQPHQVQGQSMFPTFHTGEYLLTNKISYRLADPQVGDIIVFKAPDREEFDYIKRIIGVPGDRVKILDGYFYVNGVKLDESSYLDASVLTTQERFLREGVEFVVPADTYFTAGDNRLHSSDSRDYGPVPAENIIGKAWIRYWPPQKIGLIAHARPLNYQK